MIMYEVYDKRALHRPFEGLPLLEVETARRPAERAAVAWGGVVVRVECDLVTRWPYVRVVRASRVVFVHRGHPPVEAEPAVTLREVRAKLNVYGKPTTRYKRRG